MRLSIKLTTLLAVLSGVPAVQGNNVGVQSTVLSNRAQVKDSNRPDPASYPYCTNVIKNGKFQQALNHWTDGSNNQCEVVSNENTKIHYPLFGEEIEVTFGAIADGMDALTLPVQGNDVEPFCKLYQDVEYKIGQDNSVIMAKLSWVDIITTQANNYGAGINQYADVDLNIVSPYNNGETAVVHVFETTNDNTDSSQIKITQRVADVTDSVSSMVNADGTVQLNFDMEVAAHDGPLYYQLDQVELWVCTTEAQPDPGIEGDPHFTTWHGNHYTYNGACDLVLLHSDEFADGLGMDIHVRTKHRREFSYISNAVVRIGEELFEVDTTQTGSKQAQYFVNGVQNADLTKSTISGYKIKYNRVNEHQEQFIIYLDDKQRIIIKTYKDFITVKVHNGSSDAFNGSEGLMGSYLTGALVGRDGSTVFEDINEFGQEWMVQPTEPALFQTVGNNNALNGVCKLPAVVTEEQRRRRLGENKISDAQAKKACSVVPANERDFCISDVIATQDLAIATSYIA